jgi:hypothetical protein
MQSPDSSPARRVVVSLTASMVMARITEQLRSQTRPYTASSRILRTFRPTSRVTLPGDAPAVGRVSVLCVLILAGLAGPWDTSCRHLVTVAGLLRSARVKSSLLGVNYDSRRALGIGGYTRG